MDLAEDMYQEEILELYRSPNNFGSIKNAEIAYKDYNPVCGDEVEIFVKLDGDVVDCVKFNGRGCAISQASASKLTDFIKGKNLVHLKKISSNDVLKLLPIKVSYLRIKCALLAFKALQKGMLMYQGRLAEASG